jgi:Ni2+-binding GTPase involved in maturation of urease and hydrogenase
LKVLPKLKKYTITGASQDGGTFRIKGSGTLKLINHYITVGESATFILDNISTLELEDNTAITVENGGILEVPLNKTLKSTKGTEDITVKDGGRIKNKGTISISSGRKLVLEKGAITCGNRPSGTIEGTWTSGSCD